MKALSIQQPWASMIVRGYKPVENRTWNTNFRGRFLIHAGKRFDFAGWNWIIENATALGVPPDALKLPLDDDAPHPFPRGGIIGEAELVHCTNLGHPPMEYRHPSRNDPYPWYFGPFGFWVRDARELPFRSLQGKLGFFEVHDADPA